jgi:hypothetical protein
MRDGDGEHSGGVPHFSLAASQITRPFGFDGYRRHYFSIYRQIMNCAGVRVLLGLAGHDNVRISILFFIFIFVAVAIGYLASARLVAEGGEGKIRVCG